MRGGYTVSTNVLTRVKAKVRDKLKPAADGKGEPVVSKGELTLTFEGFVEDTPVEQLATLPVPVVAAASTILDIMEAEGPALVAELRAIQGFHGEIDAIAERWSADAGADLPQPARQADRLGGASGSPCSMSRRTPWK